MGKDRSIELGTCLCGRSPGWQLDAKLSCDFCLLQELLRRSASSGGAFELTCESHVEPYIMKADKTRVADALATLYDAFDDFKYSSNSKFWHKYETLNEAMIALCEFYGFDFVEQLDGSTKIVETSSI